MTAAVEHPPRVHRKPLTVQDLLDLWHGDPNTDGDPDHHVNGYWHPELVAAVCQQLKPANQMQVRNRFYPSMGASEIPAEAAATIQAGHLLWRGRQQP